MFYTVYDCNIAGHKEGRNSLRLSSGGDTKHPYIDMSGRDAHGFLQGMSVVCTTVALGMVL